MYKDLFYIICNGIEGLTVNETIIDSEVEGYVLECSVEVRINDRFLHCYAFNDRFRKELLEENKEQCYLNLMRLMIEKSVAN